ncbi:MAG TPA: hypothetical protein VHC44_06040 [Verrucomicrobiae bacterium]|nr:hypothetical protein [Verrucomicrobiae bacterium]
MKSIFSQSRPSVVIACIFGASLTCVRASENVPHAPYAQWADVPDQGQLLVRLTYQESEAYHFWTGNKRYAVDQIDDGEHYGIDINQGYVTLQYGLTEKWAADLSFGYTTVGWRYFANGATPGAVRSTTGLMDTGFGVRYQIFKDGDLNSAWIPTLTFRAGAVLPGTYDQNIPFAPGDRSTGIEPELLARKHFGWTGLGAYADGLFRWNHTSANDHYIVAIGLFQQIKSWELDAGYRHLGSVSGQSIQFNPATQDILYPRGVRENRDSIEAGFDYRSSWHGLRIGFQSSTVFDGSNTDKKFWVGGFVEMPFGLVKK